MQMAYLNFNEFDLDTTYPIFKLIRPENNLSYSTWLQSWLWEGELGTDCRERVWEPEKILILEQRQFCQSAGSKFCY